MLKYLLLISSLLLSLPVRADDAASAAKAYQDGNFSESIALYLKLLEEYPNSASLYHNLGLAFYRNGELGAAVAAYLRATQLNPRDPDLAYNLKLLLAKGSDKLEATLPAEGWHRFFVADFFTESELCLASSLFFSLACLGGGLLVLRRRSAPFMSAGLGILGLMGLYLGANLIYKRQAQIDWGGIRDAEVPAYSSPTEKNAVVIFRLHAGAPCALLEESGDWLKVRLSDQKTGWIARKSLVVFGRDRNSYRAPGSSISKNASFPT